jgi:transketolase
MKMQDYSIHELELISNEIRQDIIKMLEHAGSGHSAGPLGEVEIYVALYYAILNHRSSQPNWSERDILIQSNGHCVPVRYATMAHVGYFDRQELQTLRRFGTRLQGHPERMRLPGLESTSGPLGCGLSQAAGLALAFRLDNQEKRRIYVVMGDGELDEGNVWEAAMFVPRHKINNLVAIIDRNNIQIDGPTEDVMPLEDLKAKWTSFGWHVIEVDGNNLEDLIDAFHLSRAIIEKPTVIIAHTIPGKGVDFMEQDFAWHGTPPNHEQAVKALHELRTLKGKITSEHL